ncbi:nitrile hydratase accessory protein [Actibacterium sp. 188UL27-1]|uniref:nitrile hydratase accessory protein n=1 Tax=Actibacterium sp. 188UL27-1 TaxID=2786961 RepID=UPI00195E9903|nr:nitrile hydratase accessory protein [Actibacterium sp. 188UL27-1]MBM7068774.1 nitrile hydratase accessory protein [Actibacterium sp. 188UL27-1]
MNPHDTAPEEDVAFTAPWQAQAFALTVALHERGVFTWPDWAQALSTALAEDGQPENSTEAYYRCWLVALERILCTHSTIEPEQITRMMRAWQRAAEATPHGTPISLANDPVSS